jgi:hypothetical protein
MPTPAEDSIKLVGSPIVAQSKIILDPISPSPSKTGRASGVLSTSSVSSTKSNAKRPSIFVAAASSVASVFEAPKTLEETHAQKRPSIQLFDPSKAALAEEPDGKEGSDDEEDDEGGEAAEILDGDSIKTDEEGDIITALPASKSVIIDPIGGKNKNWGKRKKTIDSILPQGKEPATKVKNAPSRVVKPLTNHVNIGVFRDAVVDKNADTAGCVSVLCISSSSRHESVIAFDCH